MTAIPAVPLTVGLAGLIPFLWGAATMAFPSLATFGAGILGPRFVGPYVQLAYGTIILLFMSGALWGFAARAEANAAAAGYVLSVIPAIWVFCMVGGGVAAAALSLSVGFIGVLALDWLFWRQGLTPPWWMQLRVMLTVVVVACLGATAL